MQKTLDVEDFFLSARILKMPAAGRIKGRNAIQKNLLLTALFLSDSGKISSAYETAILKFRN